MKKFNTVTSTVLPIPLKDVDTDMIIPAQFLTSISREGFGSNLFRRLRDTDADFPLNKEKFKNARIIVADSNFGCGSSREHAVWAIQGADFVAVIAKSFADIFSGNAAKNGLLLITLPSDTIDLLLKDASGGGYEITVNLESQTVVLPNGSSLSFQYDPFRKHCLLNGLDDLDYILRYKAEIDAHRQQAKSRSFLNPVRIN